MSLPLSENAAVLAPRAVLTARQRKLMKNVARLDGRRVRNGWLFGADKFSLSTTDAIKARGLIVERHVGFAKRLRLTDAGKMALERMEAAQ